MKKLIEIRDNTIVDQQFKDGVYEMEIVKKRSPEQHKLYWGLMEFFSQHCNEELSIETQEDAHEFFKYRLGVKVFNQEGQIINLKPISIKFANMGQDDFNRHFERMLVIVCNELGANKEVLVGMFEQFMLEKRK